MNGKEYLLQALKIRRQIYHIKLRYDELESKLGYHPPKLDNSGASRSTNMSDTLSDTVIEMISWGKEYDDQLCELKKKLDEMSGMIDRMENVRYIEILKWRYLTENRNDPTKLLSWIAVAYKMNLPNENAAWAMHGRAIREFEKIYSQSKVK